MTGSRGDFARGPASRYSRRAPAVAGLRDGGTTMEQVRAHEAPWPAAGRAWYAVGILFIAVIFSFVDRIILSLLVEPIKADLGLTDTHFAFLLGVAFAVFFALFGLPIGRWAEHWPSLERGAPARRRPP